MDMLAPTIPTSTAHMKVTWLSPTFKWWNRFKTHPYQTVPGGV